MVHARSRAPAWPAMFAARAESTPFVTTYHGIYNARSALKRGYNSVMAKGDIVIANSNYTGDHIIREHGTDPQRMSSSRAAWIWASSIQTAFHNRMKSRRDSWGVPQDATLILLPGRLTRVERPTSRDRGLVKFARDISSCFTRRSARPRGLCSKSKVPSQRLGRLRTACLFQAMTWIWRQPITRPIL